MNLPSILHNKRTVSISLVLFLITLIIYLLSYRGEGKNYNYFVLLADAFLHGRLYLTSSPPWLNELVNIKDHFYVASPPMPAILLTPFVLLFGISFPQPILSILIAGLNVALCFIVILKFFKNERLALWISLLYAFGTIQWYHAEVGSSWYIAHIIAMFFIWLALLEIAKKKRLFLVGLLISLAFLSRIPTIFAIFFPLIYLHQEFKNPKKIVLFVLGISFGILVNSFYNYLSFGTLYNAGYGLVPNILNEPWYKYGLISFKYIPIHLKEVFLSLPTFRESWPFVIPSLFAMSIFFTTPAFLFAFFANFKKRLEIASLITLLAIALPNLMHGGNGFTQFGYRHTLDFMPFLLILTASGIRELTWWKKLFIFLSIIINAWGVIMISFLNIWTL